MLINNLSLTAPSLTAFHQVKSTPQPSVVFSEIPFLYYSGSQCLAHALTLPVSGPNQDCLSPGPLGLSLPLSLPFLWLLMFVLGPFHGNLHLTQMSTFVSIPIAFVLHHKSQDWLAKTEIPFQDGRSGERNRQNSL